LLSTKFYRLLKASPNGKKIAIANTATRRTNERDPKGNEVHNTGNVLLFDFNSEQEL
jgi:hypothetical protein